jgi:hypothetical protein
MRKAQVGGRSQHPLTRPRVAAVGPPRTTHCAPAQAYRAAPPMRRPTSRRTTIAAKRSAVDSPRPPPTPTPAPTHNPGTEQGSRRGEVSPLTTGYMPFDQRLRIGTAQLSTAVVAAVVATIGAALVAAVVATGNRRCTHPAHRQDQAPAAAIGPHRGRLRGRDDRRGIAEPQRHPRTRG